MDEGVDWKGTEPEMARQILLQAETYLQAQLAAAIAADQRAQNMASVLITVATAVFAGSLAYWTEKGCGPIFVAGLATGALMLGGACLASWATRPTDFFYPGNQPEEWIPVRGGSLVEALGGEAENYGAHIAENDKLMGGNNRAVRWGAILAVLAPIAGLVAFGVSSLFCPA